jgi:hypothetical protein
MYALHTYKQRHKDKYENRVRIRVCGFLYLSLNRGPKRGNNGFPRGKNPGLREKMPFSWASRTLDSVRPQTLDATIFARTC